MLPRRSPSGWRAAVVSCAIGAAAIGAAAYGLAPRIPPHPSAPIPTSSFPTLPTNEREAEALVDAATKRLIRARPDADAAAILAAITAEPEAVAAGDRAVARWFRAAMVHASGDFFALFGAWHDAPGQLDAFRRLIGPGGFGGITRVGVELFRADGAWGGVSAELQRGDDAALARYEGSGDVDAFEQLAREHRDADYVAWKLGFEETALDLAVTARAMGVPLRGCDMPAALQRATGLSVSAGSPVGVPRGALLHRLRELHCVRSLPEDTGATRRIALLWGDAHLGEGGLARFLPSEASVVFVHLVGQRLEPGDLERALGAELAIAEPTLVPLRADEAVILLPDKVLGASVDRAASDEVSVGEGNVVAHAKDGGTLVVGGQTWTLPAGSAPVARTLPEGEVTYVFKGARRRVLGALRLAPGRRVELGFDEDGAVEIRDRAAGPSR